MCKNWPGRIFTHHDSLDFFRLIYKFKREWKSYEHINTHIPYLFCFIFYYSRNSKISVANNNICQHTGHRPYSWVNQAFIFKEKVIIQVLKDKPFLIKIENKEIYDGYKKDFDVLWSKL